LNQFREKLNASVKNPYQVILHQNKVPYSLINDESKEKRVKILETESFEDTFGPKKRRHTNSAMIRL
jgi:nuclear GTP-binding protein